MAPSRKRLEISLFLSLFVRRGCGGGGGDWRSAVVGTILLVVLTSPIFVSAKSDVEAEKAELEAMRFRVSELEAKLKENAETLEIKSLLLKENIKLVEELEQRAQFLNDALHERKVQDLWAQSRRNNFAIRKLESRANDAEEKLEFVASEFEKMDDVVTEQWIQIRQLEQAFHMTKVMTSKVHKRCTSKFQTGSSQIKNMFFKLQYTVREAMGMNKYTAALANEEVVFFLASAIIVFPALSAAILCSSYFL